MARVRVANRALALGTVVLAVLWLTPLSAPNTWSVNSQLARFEAEEITVEQLPLWEMREDWGRAGARGLAHLRDLAGNDTGLAARLAHLDVSDNRWSFRAPRDVDLTEETAVEAILAAPGMALAPESLRAALEVFAPRDVLILARHCNNNGAARCLWGDDMRPDVTGNILVEVNRNTEIWRLDAGAELRRFRAFDLDGQGRWRDYRGHFDGEFLSETLEIQILHIKHRLFALMPVAD